MWGIAGYVRVERRTAEQTRSTLVSMEQSISHRGPDGVGYLVTDEVAFTHRRPSILDVSSTGDQLRSSRCGTVSIIFDGEVYNHLDIRKRLDTERQINWIDTSDTETLNEAIARWDLADTLRLTSGMFALAIWNHETKTLQLARDRIGEKPLYFDLSGKDFVFASELKPVQAHSDFRKTISRPALAEYFRYNYVPAPLSTWDGVFKLIRRSILILDYARFKANAPLGPQDLYEPFLPDRTVLYTGQYSKTVKVH